eukprot:115093-Chlamydomonas_euryale.AAC.2
MDMPRVLRLDVGRWTLIPQEISVGITGVRVEGKESPPHDTLHTPHAVACTAARPACIPSHTHHTRTPAAACAAA